MAQFVSTAYGPPWEGIQGTGVTATGINLKNAPPRFIVAVDPTVIPLGSILSIQPNPFNAPFFYAGDTGGKIKGNRIDFYDWRGRAKQLAWGTRNVNVKVLHKGSGHGSSDDYKHMFQNVVNPNDPVGDPLKGAVNAVTGPVNAVTDASKAAAGAISDVVSYLFGSEAGAHYLRIGKVIGGLVLILLGLKSITGISVADVAAKGAKSWWAMGTS